MMQYVELDKNFDYANMNIGFNFKEGADGTPAHPLGDRYTGVIRNDGTGIVAVFDFSPEELPTFHYVIKAVGDRVIMVEGGSEELSVHQKLRFNSSGWLLPEPGRTSEADHAVEQAPSWYYESLNWEWGEGLLLPADIPSAEYLSKILQQESVASYVIKSEHKNNALREFILKNVEASFRFVQYYSGRLKDICSRIVYIPLAISEVKKEESTSSDCEDGDICLEFRVRQPTNVIPCELSKI